MLHLHMSNMNAGSNIKLDYNSGQEEVRMEFKCCMVKFKLRKNWKWN